MFKIKQQIVEDRCIYFIENEYDGYILWEGEDYQTALNKLYQFERRFNG